MTKRYGIRITLPAGDVLAAPHLLGPDWAGYRWYDTKAERDEGYAQMLSLPPYYRRDEQPGQVLTRVESEE